MSVFDKVKAQAAQVAQMAQEAGKAGQSKLADAQGRRQADSLLHDLGLAVLASRTGRGVEQTDAEIQRLVDALVAYEREHGPLFGDGSASGADMSAVPASNPVPTSVSAPAYTAPVPGSVPAGAPAGGPAPAWTPPAGSAPAFTPAPGAAPAFTPAPGSAPVEAEPTSGGEQPAAASAGDLPRSSGTTPSDPAEVPEAPSGPRQLPV